MSQFVYLKQADGQLIKVLADDNGTIQQSYNGDSSAFTGLISPIADGAITTAKIADGAVTVDKQTASVTEVTLVSAANDITITGLDGNNDGIYEIFYSLDIDASGGAVTYEIRPNGLTTNLRSNVLFAADVSVGALGASSTIKIDAVADTGVTTGVIRVDPKTGHNRQFMVEGFRHSTDTLTYTIGSWLETSTNMTSIVIHSSGTNTLKIGSYMRLRKIK